MAKAKRQYIIDDKGRKTAVILPLKEYEELLEDLQDLALIAEQRHEPTEPWEEVKRRLEAKWLNTE